MPSPVFYATVLPLAVYVVVKKGFVEPFLKEQLLRKLEKKKQENYTKLLERRREAEAAQELMTATYERIKNEEERKNGLVIVKALYGRAQTGGCVAFLSLVAIDVLCYCSVCYNRFHW